LFWKRSSEGKGQAGAGFSPSAPSGPRARRHSSGWANILAFLKENEDAVVMDVGPTSPSNVNFLTTLGCSIYLPDPLHDLAVGDWAGVMSSDDPAVRDAGVERFLNECFTFSGRVFDCVLLWDTLDYLPEPLLQPLVDRLFDVVRPGGKVLSIYRSKKEEGASVHRRFHVTDSDHVESQNGAGYPQLRVLQNRNVEKLFHKFHSPKFSIATDNLREVVFTR
jgi:hypothetical protein